jgi:TonB family protein
LTECDRELPLAESYIRRALDLVDRSQASAMHGTMSAAIGHQNTLSTHLDTYGWLLLKGGKTDRALELFDASLALAPRADVYAHLAEAETKAGRSDQALVHWREARSLEPELRVPPDVAGKLESIPARSLDRGWYPMKADLPKDALEALSPEQSRYFFAVANPDGAVESARELDGDDPVAKQLVAGIRALTFRVVQVDAVPVPTVHILKVAREKDGEILVAQSLSTEAVAIASELAPGEFPLPAPAPPQTAPAAAAVYRPGSGIVPPQVLRKLEPRYSEEARRAHLAGSTTLRGVVGPDGRARELKVIRPLGMGLDENAIQAVTAWEFAPGMKDGQPVNVIVTVIVNFRLLAKESPGIWHLSRADFNVPQDALRPFLQKTADLRVPRDASRANATVTFDINEQGLPVNIQIEKTSDDAWARQVTTSLREWRFIPGYKNLNPLSIPCTMEFVRGDWIPAP